LKQVFITNRCIILTCKSNLSYNVIEGHLKKKKIYIYIYIGKLQTRIFKLIRISTARKLDDNFSDKYN
jgi:hypothetical protein